MFTTHHYTTIQPCERPQGFPETPNVPWNSLITPLLFMANKPFVSIVCWRQIKLFSTYDASLHIATCYTLLSNSMHVILYIPNVP